MTPPKDPLKGQEEIGKVRTGLDSIDTKIIELLGERRRLSSVVASTKLEAGLPVRDLKREESLLLERMKLAKEHGLDSHFITKLFHEIIDDSVRLQRDLLQRNANAEGAVRTIKVAFHGIEGSYSYIAAQRHFARSQDAISLIGCGTFEAVLREVETGQADYALLPVESSAAGGLSESYELLLRSQVALVGEEILKIDHCLIGLPSASLSSLKRIYCNGQAASECRNFLNNLRGVKIELCTDSATSVRKIKEENDDTQGAIASEEAAMLFGLQVLARDIANQHQLSVRYVVCARAPRKVDLQLACKTSIVMATLNQPGSLADALAIFREHGVNLTKLESRRVADNQNEEMFYVDFEGNLEDGRVTRTLEELTKCTRYLKVLGCYPSYDLPRSQVSLQSSDSSAPKAAHAPAPSSSVSAEKAEAKREEKPKSEKKGYKLASREFKAADTVIDVKGVKIGGDTFVVMAGPCSVESYEQIMGCAREARENGALVLRGGCFKPRTSPYSFQGLGLTGLDFMVEAGRTFGMPIITEVMAEEDLDAIAEKADILQIGARNMQNYSLLKAIGRVPRPVMLKRSLSAPVEELLQAVEYILAGGNQQVMLCERGIRTFETATRYTLDLSAIPVLKKRTHLPIIVDPSHAAGERDLVSPLALAAKAVGAHGIIVEFHPEPEKALSDGPQALRYHQFEKLMADLARIPAVIA